MNSKRTTLSSARYAVKLLNHDLPLSSSWSQINNLSIEKCWQMLNHLHV